MSNHAPMIISSPGFPPPFWYMRFYLHEIYVSIGGGEPGLLWSHEDTDDAFNVHCIYVCKSKKLLVLSFLEAWSLDKTLSSRFDAWCSRNSDSNSELLVMIAQVWYDHFLCFESMRRQNVSWESCPMNQWSSHLWSTPKKLTNPGFFLVLLDLHTQTQWILNTSSVLACGQSRPGSFPSTLIWIPHK